MSLFFFSKPSCLAVQRPDIDYYKSPKLAPGHSCAIHNYGRLNGLMIDSLAKSTCSVQVHIRTGLFSDIWINNVVFRLNRDGSISVAARV